MIIEELKELIKGVMPDLDTTGVTEESNLFTDLHFDSLGIMMLAMAIEDKYGIQFTEAINFATVKDVVKYIEENK